MDLNQYIDKVCAGNISRFSRESGIPRTTINKILAGAIPRADRALDIESATSKRVTVAELAGRPIFPSRRR